MTPTATATTTTCYRQMKGLMLPEIGWVVCPDSYQGLCCGLGAECLDEQICHDPKNSLPGGSGYYIGLCNDTEYKSPSCSSRCTDKQYGDVVYKSSDNLWACCGTNESCDNPTNETFLALAPQQLLAAASSQSASSATASSSSQPQTTAASNSASKATVTVTNTPSVAAGYQETSSSLSGGAKAGIGVGAAVAAVAIIALLVWVILLRKGMRSNDQNRYLTGKRDGGVLNEGSSNEAREIAVREQELGGYGLPHEMEGIP